MELLQLKRRVRLARRGHKLLKDKLDELMRQFKILISDYEGARAGLEGELHRAYSRFLFARAAMRRESMLDALAHPGPGRRSPPDPKGDEPPPSPVQGALEGNVRTTGFSTPRRNWMRLLRCTVRCCLPSCVWRSRKKRLSL
jgi:hypothetical protein